MIPRLYTKSIEVKAADIDTSKRTVTGVITTDSVDSDQEVVMTEGLDMTAHEKNPVVLFMHNPSSVVGKCNDRRRRKKSIVAMTQFAETELADEVFQLYVNGFLKGWSIGMDFSTVVRREITPDDVRKRKDWAGARWIIEKAKMVEYSAVSIPANSEALTEADEKGMLSYTKAALTAEGLLPEVPVVDVGNIQPITVVGNPARVQPAWLKVSDVEAVVQEHLDYVRGFS